ncbi:hypothetical protein PLESTM_001861000 [Pleodorina starrii]|nr:hypothetical protein PLESTM_001861000 [Pleodorina starrii]
MLCANIARRARGLVSALLAPVPKVNFASGLRTSSVASSELKFVDILEALIKSSSPKDDDRDKRLRVINELQQSLGKAHLGPTIDLRILPFGSFVNSLYEPSSDLDLAIVGQIVATDDLSPEDKRFSFVKLQLAKVPREYATEILRTAVSRFVEDGLADERSLVPVLHARVPIIKFVHPATGINVDVCVGSEGDSFKTWSLAQLMALHPVVEKLCRLVKIWAKAHGINDPRSFTFNSWCLTLLVVFFLQRQATPELLPPLKALMYDCVGAAGAVVRLMHGGRHPPNKRVVKLMETVTRNAGPAREMYGRRPAKPLEHMFLDFLDSNSRLLQAAMKNKEPLTRGTAVSVFYGDFHRERHFREHVLFVEDPLNDLDNAARTLRLPSSSKGRTIEFVEGTLAKSAARLRAHLDAAAAAHQPSGAPGAATALERECELSGEGGATAADAASSSASPTSTSATAAATKPESPSSSNPVSGDGTTTAAAEGPESRASASTAAATTAASSAVAASASSGSSSVPPSLATTAVFLFGTELLTRLPELSERLLGPGLCGWARGALAAGRPAGEVHQELLARLGAEQGFEPFASFRKRCRIPALDEEEAWTPEELELLIRKQTEKMIRQEKEAAARAREREKHRQHRKERRARLATMRESEEKRSEKGPGLGGAEKPGEAPARAEGTASVRPPRRFGPPRPVRFSPLADGSAAAEQTGQRKQVRGATPPRLRSLVSEQFVPVAHKGS